LGRDFRQIFTGERRGKADPSREAGELEKKHLWEGGKGAAAVKKEHTERGTQQGDWDLRARCCFLLLGGRCGDSGEKREKGQDRERRWWRGGFREYRTHTPQFLARGSYPPGGKKSMREGGEVADSIEKGEFGYLSEK